MSKPLLAVDVDEVLFPCFEAMLADHNDRYGTSNALADIETFDLHRHWGCSVEEGNNRVLAFINQDHRSIEPLASAVAVLRRLRHSYRLVILTSRQEEMRKFTELWLMHHFAGVFDDVVLIGNHYSSVGAPTKAAACLELKATVLVDDNPHYIAQCQAAGVQGILFGEYPWNKQAPIPDGAWRAASWTDVESLLCASAASAEVQNAI